MKKSTPIHGQSKPESTSQETRKGRTRPSSQFFFTD